MSSDQLIQLAYVSTSVQYISPEDLSVLVEQFDRWNVENDITGMLVYKDETFLQVIEGTVDAINHLFDKILLDPRHINVYTIYISEIKEREFGNWGMTYLVPQIDELLSIEDACDYIQNGKVDRRLFENDLRSHDLLIHFKAICADNK